MRHSSIRRRESGFSMVEVLVALVIFAFGLLGAAGLQLASLKSNQQASAAATAVALAKEYGELMQTYPSSVIKTSEGTSTFFIDTDVEIPGSTLACSGATVDCTSDQLAQALIKDWTKRVRNDLPGGRAEICRTSEPRDSSGNLQWGNCDGVGDLVIAKMGWAVKKTTGSSEAGAGVGTAWMTEDRPRLALPLIGNLKDFAAP